MILALLPQLFLIYVIKSEAQSLHPTQQPPAHHKPCEDNIGAQIISNTILGVPEHKYNIKVTKIHSNC